MEQFYKESGFVIGFLVLVLILQTAFGDKIAQKFCLFTLLGMMLLNAETFTEWLGNTFTFKERTTTASDKTIVHESASGERHSGSSRGF